MRVLIAPAGSRGDIQPMLALTAGLRSAGHEVCFAAAPNYAKDVEPLGATFVSVGQDVQAIIRDSEHDVHGAWKGVQFLARHFKEEVRRQFDGLFSIQGRFDVVLTAGAQMAALPFAQKRGVPCRGIAYCPELIPSPGHAPLVIPWLLPSAVNRALWRVFRLGSNRFFAPAYNEARVRHGLPKVDDFIDAMVGRLEDNWLAADPELITLPPDLKGRIPVVGAFQSSSDEPLPEHVLSFIQSGPAPVYLGFGSMPDPRPEQTSALLESAVTQAKVRAIIFVGWSELSATQLRNDILYVGPMNHGRLLPLLAAAVHHGGAGTTAAVARAGIPQVVVPHSFDQFGWARRTVEAGVSPGSIERAKLTAERLASLLHRAVNDATYRQQAQKLAVPLRARPAVANVVQRLEDVGGWTPARSPVVTNG